MLLDLTVSPENPLYEGLGVEVVGGRANLPNALDPKTLNVIGENAKKQVDATDDRREVVLTGPAPVQAYLIALHVVLHVFNQVVYQDGKGNRAIIAKHG